MYIIKNFLRNFRANKKSDIINMLSLIPGLACCLLIMAWVILEVRTDRSFPKIDRIVCVQGYHEGQSAFWGAPPAVAPTIKGEYPEVEDAVRIALADLTVKYEQESFNITSYDADATVFSLFDLNFLEGEAFHAGETNKCVITRQVSQNIFGGASAIGKFLDFEFGNFVVCGVIENLPKNSTVANNGNTSGLSIILSIDRNSEGLIAWYNNSYETYVLLKDKNLFDAFKEKVKTRAVEAQPQNQLYLSANLLKDRYLYTLGNIKNVRIMAIIAIIILLVAGINFVNLATAGFSVSSFQTGLRKVMGATKGALVIQYFLNTFILVLISSVIAVMLAVLILPFFNSIIDGNFTVSDLFSPFSIFISIGIIIVTAFLAGLYPAIYISSFEPTKVLKGKGIVEGRNAGLRHVLVVLQFAVAATLIIGTTVIMK
ncbi:MAG: ABC transporter permease [Odoribacter sp.]|nr:ABC transporter permease [Odoribacter sp.]